MKICKHTKSYKYFYPPSQAECEAIAQLTGIPSPYSKMKRGNFIRNLFGPDPYNYKLVIKHYRDLTSQQQQDADDKQEDNPRMRCDELCRNW